MLIALRRVGKIKILGTTALARCLPNGSLWPHYLTIAGRIKEKKLRGQTVKIVYSFRSRALALRGTMKTKAIIVLALQLVTLVVADSKQEDENSLEHLEGRLTRAMDELNRKDTIGIYGDMVTLEKIAENEESSKESVDPLVSRIEKFLRTRKLQINFPDDTSTAGLFGRALGQHNINVELRGLTHGASEGKNKFSENNCYVFNRRQDEIECWHTLFHVY